VAEVVLRQGLVERALETPVDAADPVDDALDFEVDLGGQLFSELLEEAIDVVGELVASSSGHRRSL
jgi:hypothetical protein